MGLTTPLGEISVLIDNEEVPYSFARLKADDPNCCVDGRYKIEIDFEPDGKNHLLSCCLNAACSVQRELEPGERLECISYYNNDEKIKVSIGLEANTGYFYNEADNLVRLSNTFDYDSSYEIKGNIFYHSYELLDTTKTKHYIFGIAWLNNCNEENDVNTWFAVDPGGMDKEQEYERSASSGYRN